MEYGKLSIASRKETERAIETLEGLGDRMLKKFLGFINDPEYARTPIGRRKDCFSLGDARLYIKHKMSGKDIPVSLSQHINSCRFCRKMVEPIPIPNISNQFMKRIKEADKVRKQGSISAILNHFVLEGARLQSACVDLKGEIPVMMIDRSSIIINQHKVLVSGVEIADCDHDRIKELKLIFEEHPSLKKYRVLDVSGNLKDGRHFHAHARIK